MKNSQGFTLIETMIALTILGFVALMASQGLSGAFRAKNKVEHEIANQERFIAMMKHFQNDCETMVKNTDQNLPPTFISGSKFVWILRHYSSRQLNGWQLVGYTIEANSLKRFVSDTYPDAHDTARILEALSKDPDGGLASTQLTYQLEGVTKQNLQAFWSSYSNKSPIGLSISLAFSGSTIPLTSSCIADGRL